MQKHIETLLKNICLLDIKMKMFGEKIMNEKVNIWLMGNTGVRTPNRIQEALRIFSESPFVGNLRSDNEGEFMKLLNEKGIIHNNEGKDPSSSYARKWRLMFARHGFIYPKIKKNQEMLGREDDITPFGRLFLTADTYSAVQELYLRAMSVEQYSIADRKQYFSPLRWILAIMLKLEEKTDSSELKRTEFEIWGQATDPSYDLDEIVDNIIDFRKRKEKAQFKGRFDKAEIRLRIPNYNENTVHDYSDMNLRYLHISGMFQRKGRGIVIEESKHILAEKLAKYTVSEVPLIDQYKILCTGAPLPSDDIKIASEIFNHLKDQLNKRHIEYDISDLPLTTSAEINLARHKLEERLFQDNEVKYAKEQCKQWNEIADYMSLIMRGGGKIPYDEENVIEVPKTELPAYFEWTLWRAFLAIDHMVNKPYEVRGFKLDSDFMPVSVASGGRGDLCCEFNDFVILVEVTMSTSSRQEAMEGEPVRRHVSDAVLQYKKPVYGIFIARSIDNNTAETFRNGIWYAKNGEKQRLEIVPLTLAQFQKCFVSMFKSNSASPERLVNILKRCEIYKDCFEAPEWKQHIALMVDEDVDELTISSVIPQKKQVIPPHIKIHDKYLGTGIIVNAIVKFSDYICCINTPYYSFKLGMYNVYDELHGAGVIVGYVVRFQQDKLNERVLSVEQVERLGI